METKNHQLNKSTGSSNLFLILTSLVFALLVVGNLYSWLKNIEYRNQINILEKKLEDLSKSGGGKEEERKKKDEHSRREKLSGEYRWTDLSLQNQYEDVLWNKIVSGNTEGLSPKIPVTEKEETIEDSVQALKKSGCRFIFSGSWLETSDGTRIDTKEKLIATFGPIENEVEAISFLGLTERSLISENEILIGLSLSVDDGFLIQVKKSHDCGCGDPRDRGVIYKVTKNGEITLVAGEILPPADVWVCID